MVGIYGSLKDIDDALASSIEERLEPFREVLQVFDSEWVARASVHLIDAEPKQARALRYLSNLDNPLPQTHADMADLAILCALLPSSSNKRLGEVLADIVETFPDKHKAALAFARLRLVALAGSK